MKHREILQKYLTSLLRHGWEESWFPDLTFEQVAAIAALSNNAVIEGVESPEMPADWRDE